MGEGKTCSLLDFDLSNISMVKMSSGVVSNHTYLMTRAVCLNHHPSNYVDNKMISLIQLSR